MTSSPQDAAAAAAAGPLTMEVPTVIAYPQDHDFDDSMSHIDDCGLPADGFSSSSLHYNHHPNHNNSSRIISIEAASSSTPPQLSAVKQLRTSQTVRVQVGGEHFSFSHGTFQRFLALPWKCDVDGVFHLDSCSAAVFEVLLDYTLFETLPAYDTLCDDEFQEFEVMALAMGFHDLVHHFDRKDSYLVKELRQRKKPAHAQPGGDPLLLNPATRSPTSVAANRCVQFLGALCGAGLGSPSAAPLRTLDDDVRRFKLTHGEFVSSQNVS